MMNLPKLPSAFHPRPSVDQARYIENSLNCHVGPDGREIITIGPDFDLLARLDDFIRLSLEARLPPFRIDWPLQEKWVWEVDVLGKKRSVPRLVRVKTVSPNSACPASEELAGLLQFFAFAAVNIFDPSEWDRDANQLRYAPHLRLLRDVFLCDPISARLNCDHSCAIDDPSRTLKEIYNDFSSSFRQVFIAKKPLLQRELHNWGWGSQENVVNLDAYLDGLFVRYRSVSVLHLRLFHAKERAKLISDPVEDQHRDLRTLRECRKKFFGWMRRKPSLFTDHPGYVWSILPSLESGYSLHLTLLFDTVALRKVVDDLKAEDKEAGEVLQSHADQIGAYWVDVGAKGRGDYLHADQNTMLSGPDWVHGEVGADDLGRREKLKKTLGYLAMRRALVRLITEPRGEYFGMRNRKVRVPRRPDGGGEHTE